MQATRVVIALLMIAAPVRAQIPKNVPQAIPLWPKGAPGSEGRATEAEEIIGSNVCKVHNPTLTPYVPDAVFLAAGYNDRPDIAEGLARVYLKYKAAKVPAELHIFANVGHGFGYRHDAKTGAAGRWPERFTDWLTDSRLLK